LPILAQKLSRIGDWGGSNLDANSLQSGSVLDAIQQALALLTKDRSKKPKSVRFLSGIGEGDGCISLTILNFESESTQSTLSQTSAIDEGCMRSGGIVS
jgi:hypothetical protein